MARRRYRRNAPLTADEIAALKSVLGSHGAPCSNPRRRVRRGRKLSKLARRRIALRNLRTARRPRKVVRRSLRSRRSLTRWAKSQVGKHQTGARGYAIVRSFRVRPSKGRRIKLPGLRWSGKKGTVKFSASHHDPDYYGGSLEEFPVKFTNPRRVLTRGGKRFVRITTKRGKKVAEFRIKRTRKGRVPARLRKFLFKAGSARTKRMLAKARKGYRAWRLRQLAKRRAAKRPVRRHARRGRRVVRRVVRRTVRKAKRHSRRRYVFTRARRLALKKAQRASRRSRR